MTPSTHLVCIEGDWEHSAFSRLRSGGFFQSLEYLADAMYGRDHLRVSYLSAFTMSELSLLLSDLAHLDRAEQVVLWLGFHGRPGVIEVHGAKSRPRSKNLAAAELATRLIPPDVNLSMVHFSSRSVLRGKKGLGVARAFSDMGVGVVSGYTKTVDWWESLLFDHLFLSRFLRLAEPGSPGSPRNFDPSTRATKQQAGRIGKSLAEDLLPMARRFGLRLLLCGGGDPIPVPIESTAGSPWPLRLHPRSGTQRRDHLRSVLGM